MRLSSAIILAFVAAGVSPKVAVAAADCGGGSEMAFQIVESRGLAQGLRLTLQNYRPKSVTIAIAKVVVVDALGALVGEYAIAPYVATNPNGRRTVLLPVGDLSAADMKVFDIKVCTTRLMYSDGTTEAFE